jgi:hypothetical protein
VWTCSIVAPGSWSRPLVGFEADLGEDSVTLQEMAARLRREADVLLHERGLLAMTRRLGTTTPAASIGAPASGTYAKGA